MLGLLAACGTEDGTTSEEEVSEFVRVEGQQFVVGGKPHAFTGVNFWAAMNLGVAGPSGDRDRLMAELDLLADLGVRHLRIMASSEGPGTEPYRITTVLQVAPGEYSQEVFEGLDFVLDECSKRDIRVVMVLTNFWEWSGGMAQYVSWYEGTQIPYPADTVWTDFTAYSSKFYDCEQCQEWYRDFIMTVVNRQNSINGVIYRDDPTIFAWELGNEPRLYPPAWIGETADFIKSLDQNHLVTTGSEGEVGGPFLETHGFESIDYATLHIWPQNWSWFDPENPETYEEAEVKALEYLSKHVEMAEQLGKPLVLEEFGLARDWSESLDNHDPNAPTTIRDKFFQRMFDEVAESARRGGPLVGDSLWAWGGQGRPGDDWVGDPPHERPGWYSVFDADDSTLEIMAAHAARLRE
jgi:mannan endo-1,4-beta-mannosidase